MPYVTVAGERAFYALYQGDVRGKRHLVLVHGAGGSHLDWPAPLRRLRETNVYALDLPGHGRSGGTGRSSIAAYRDFLLTPSKYSVYLRDHIPGAELMLVDGAGHMVMLEKPEVVSKTISRFIASLI